MRAVRKTREYARRIAAAVLCLCMALSMTGSADLPVPASGAGEEESLCTHVHDAACGYSEGVPCDRGCAETDENGQIVHEPDCAYVPAAPCAHVHDETCGGLPETQGEENPDGGLPSGDEADPALPGGEEDPPKEPDPDAAGDEQPEDGETVLGGAPGEEDPGVTDDEIAPIALSEVEVSVKPNGGGEGTKIETGTELTWEHNQLWQLDVSANFNGVENGQVKITVAPGLRIQSHYEGAAGSIESVETSATHLNELEGYTFPQTYDTVTYQVSSTANAVSLDLTLAVDTVLWPKTSNWKISDAITVDITGADTSEKRTANVTVNPATNETSASWNQLHCSDSNLSVPTQADKEFRLKTLVISPNLHNTPLGMYFPKLSFTMPLPKLSSAETYAVYSRIDTAPDKPPKAEVNDADHTVTFTWENLYIPAGNSLTVTPYFKWEAAQSEGAQVVFSDASKLKVEAQTYPGNVPVSFTVPSTLTTSPTFVVHGDVSVAFKAGGGRQIYNYGSTSQVYQLGQFLVRNDGLGEGGTGPLTLTFSYPEDNTALVTAQRIPLKANGQVTRLSYVTDQGTYDSVELDAKYYYRGSYQSYLVMAPAGEHFKSITATVDGYGPLYVGYNSSAEMSPSNGCVTYGTMAARETTGSFQPRLSISGDSLTAAVTSTYSSTIVTNVKSTTQMKIEPGSPLFTFQDKSANKVQLGTDLRARTVGFSGYISATEYPYTNNQVVDRPVIYIRLPQTIKVDQSSIHLYTSKTDFSGAADGPDALVDSGSYTVSGPLDQGGAGFHVYKIEFNTGSYAGAIGWFNENLGQTRLRLDFNMVADVDVTDVILQMYETVLVGYADGSTIADSGSLSANQRADANDVDGDGNITEKFSTMTDSSAYRLELDAPRIGLDFNSHAKLSTEDGSSYSNYKAPANNVESLEAAGHIMYLTSETLETEGTGIDFRFTAVNNTGANLSIKSDELGSEDFYYYIPVPKKGDNWDAHIQDAAFGLSLTLEEQVELSETVGSGLVEVLYSTTVDASRTSTSDPLHYNNASTVSSNYQSWDSITDKNAIRMIRISVKQELDEGTKSTGFPVGYSATFVIHYKFDEADKNELVGQYIEFGPCGITSYKRNGTDDSGHTPTQRIRAEIQTGRIGGRLFIDSNFNNQFDPGEQIALGANGIAISAVHKSGADAGLDPDPTTHNAIPAAAPNRYDNSYELTGLQARTYTVTVNNGAYSAGAPNAGSLRFIALGEGAGGTREVTEVGTQTPQASSYTPGYRESTSFEVTLISDAESSRRHQMLDIGLQPPRAVTFHVEYVDDFSSAASSHPEPLDDVTVYVWDGETLDRSGVSIPEFVLDGDFQWEGGHAQWSDDAGNELDAGSTAVNSNVIYTATAVRKQHNVTYHANLPAGYSQGTTDVPGQQQAVNGQSVQLKCVGADATAKPTVTGDSAVVFIGWAEASDSKIYGKSDTRESVSSRLRTELTMGAADVNVYALWGYDTNGNGTADVLEERYTVTYSAGEGENPPDPVTNCLVNEKFNLDRGEDMTKPTGDGRKVLFVGWMDNNPGKIYAKGETLDGAVRGPGSEYTVAGTATLYALWAYDENDNDTPDYQETMHALHYRDNGVTPHPGDYPEDGEYLPGTEVALVSPASWTGVRSGQPVVFVGWSLSAQDPFPFTSTPTGVIVDRVTINNSDVDVYAVWALDTNNNGTPDYSEPHYNLHYDSNGGSGDPAEPLADVPILPGGSSVPLPNSVTIHWTKKNGDLDGVFVGWSLEQAEDIFDQDGKATVDGRGEVTLSDDNFLLTSPYRIDESVEADITLYAVYAEDEDGDGTADYREDAWQVYYYANGGVSADPGVTVDEDDLFRMCGHHHVANEKDVKLIDLATGKTLIRRDGAVLLGWSELPNVSLVKSAEEQEAAAITEAVDIPAAAVDGNLYVKVYAVWAEDRNENGIADYADARLHQWYFSNKQLAIWRPDGSEDYTEAQGIDAANPDGVNNVNFGTGTLPDTVDDILIGTAVTVPDPTLMERWDYDAEGRELHHYIQLGWSGYCHPAASSDRQAASWLHADEDLDQPGTQRIVRDANYQYNFAVWAPDDNYNGSPDYNDGHFSLTFDLKGGSGGPGNQTDVLEGVDVALSPAPTKAQALFLGWSTKDLCSGGDLRAATTEALLSAEADWKMPGENTTLYAVWAVDRDNNSQADYEQTVTVTYHDNAKRGGSVSNMPVPRVLSVPFSDLSFVLSGLTPVHTPADGQDVAFIAWSTNSTSSLYSRSGLRDLQTAAPEGTRFAPGSVFPLPADAGNVDLYAVWGYDQNGKNGADVLETRYTLRYDGNGNGGGHTPNPVYGRLEGDRVELSKDAQHSRDDVVLAGWTTLGNRVEEILTWDDSHSLAAEIDSRLMTDYTMGAADATVYAVWAEDLNGNDIPDYREEKNILTYHYTGAAAPEGLTQGAGYLPGTEVTLWTDAKAGTLEAWSKGEGGGRSVFAGWTLSEEKADKVYAEAPLPEDLAGTAVMTGDVEAYALWARDRNANGVPDYSDRKITLTLDPNGGMEGTEAAVPLYLADLLPGTYTGLASEEAAAWTKTEGGTELIFAGWSALPMGGYIGADGLYRSAARAEGIPAEDILLSDPYPVPSENGILYAVYAADENGGKGPDYMENAVHVEYYANGGVSADGKWLNGTEELFYICAHRHAPQATETEMLTVEQGAAYISRPGAVLAGWGARPAGLCLTKAQVAAALIRTVKLPAQGKGNAKLYAVWAADADENGVPDYQETAPGPVGTLSVTKTVQGRAGERERQWHFRVELSDARLNGLYGDMLFEGGAAEFTLRHGQTATAPELPAGLTYTVTEREAGEDGYATEQTGETGAIPEGKTAQASFVNSRETAPVNGVKTGDGAQAGYWLGLMLLSSLGFLLAGTPLPQKRPRRAAGKHARK